MDLNAVSSAELHAEPDQLINVRPAAAVGAVRENEDCDQVPFAMVKGNENKDRIDEIVEE